METVYILIGLDPFNDQSVGEPLDVFSHPLTGVYINSFTLDMLKSGDSSKSSIFAKLARLMVEN